MFKPVKNSLTNITRNLANPIKRGISLKPEFKEERQKQRQLQAQYEYSVYISETIKNWLCLVHHDKGAFTLPQGVVPHGKYIFVRMLTGEIYIAKEDQISHHSYLSNGKKVLSTGYMAFDEGRLYLVSNESGHYTPTNEEFWPELSFYYTIAQNDKLIYEDHSRVPKEKLIYQYQVKDLLGKTQIDATIPTVAVFSRSSRYGKKLRPLASNTQTSAPSRLPAQTSVYLDDLLFFKTAPHSNYLPDGHLMIGCEYNTSLPCHSPFS